MNSAAFEIQTTYRRGGQFGMIVRLSWGNQTMADMKSFAHTLADEAKQKLAALAEPDRMQLHRARVLDAESRPFWQSVGAELSVGVREYDSSLKGTPLEQERIGHQDADAFSIKWRYPRPQELAVAFDFERRLIILEKRNLNGPGDAHKEFRLDVDRDDKLFASDQQNAPIGGPTELAQTILKFMLAGSMA
jgi:hypothetical protein